MYCAYVVLQAGCASFIIAVARQCPHDLAPFTGMYALFID